MTPSVSDLSNLYESLVASHKQRALSVYIEDFQTVCNSLTEDPEVVACLLDRFKHLVRNHQQKTTGIYVDSCRQVLEEHLGTNATMAREKEAHSNWANQILQKTSRWERTDFDFLMATLLAHIKDKAMCSKIDKYIRSQFQLNPKYNPISELLYTDLELGCELSRLWGSDQRYCEFIGDLLKNKYL
jgi:hypothetical protein